MNSQTAIERCAGIGTRDCEHFRAQIFRRHIWLSHALASRYLQLARAKGYKTANKMLAEISELLQVGGTGLNADSDDGVFQDYATAKAQSMEKEIFDFGRRFGALAAFEYAEKAIATAGFESPYKPKPSDDHQTDKQKRIAALARVSDAKWWRRQVRTMAARKVEQACRLLGGVRKGKAVYVSDYTLNRRIAQRGRNRSILNGLIATNEDGFSGSLAEMSDKGISNAENKRNELVCRMSGYHEIADAMGMSCVFITLTTPSKYHSATTKGHGKKSGSVLNPKFNGSTPREAQDYLNGVWQKVRACWHREKVRVFGFRVVEPHADGTPHWHMMLYVDKSQLSQAMAVFRLVAIREELPELINLRGKGEKVQLGRRFDVKELDMSLGNTAGYMMKYIAKNIDGHAVGLDFEADDYADKTAARVEAWATTWGIRQFQQIGSVSVTVWRELRRGVSSEVFKNCDDETLTEIAHAASNNDWAKFVDLMGGALVERDAQLLRPLQVLTDKENNYGEFFKRVRGVIMRGAQTYITRIHTWTITPKPMELKKGETKPFAKLRGFKRGAEPPALGLSQ